MIFTLQKPKRTYEVKGKQKRKFVMKMEKYFEIEWNEKGEWKCTRWSLVYLVATKQCSNVRCAHSII